MRKVFLNILFWLIFFLMWNRVMYYYIDNNLNRLYFSALDVSLVIVAFYSIYFYIMPRYLRRKNLWFLLISCTFLIAALSVIASGLMLVFLRHQLMPIHFEFYWNYTDMQYNRFFIALIGVLGGCFVKLALDRIALGKRMEQMEKEKSVAELTYLRSQINPHFLFNAINSLYAQMELNSTHAKTTLIALADLLRYQLYDCNADRIPVTKEIEYLSNYFNLQRIRMDNCACDFEISPPRNELYIAPLLLIPFLENAFKYVSDFDSGENYIKVKLEFIQDKLCFSCVNTMENVPGREGAARHQGIGLVNVKKRLELIYGNNHLLQTVASNNLYKVQLEINLKNAQLFDH